MIIGVLKDPSPETRVSLLPEHIATLKKWNTEILIETNAGLNAFATDDKYSAAGASIDSRESILQKATVILSMNPLSDEDISQCKAKMLFGLNQPLYNASL